MTVEWVGLYPVVLIICYIVLPPLFGEKGETICLWVLFGPLAFCFAVAALSIIFLTVAGLVGHFGLSGFGLSLSFVLGVSLLCMFEVNNKLRARMHAQRTQHEFDLADLMRRHESERASKRKRKSRSLEGESDSGRYKREQQIDAKKFIERRLEELEIEYQELDAQIRGKPRS